VIGASKGGFSLVEVMVAFAVLILCICGSLTILTKGFLTIDTARCSTLAGQIMQSRIETLRLMNWTQIQGQAAKTFTQAELQNLVPADAASLITRFGVRQEIVDDVAREMRTVTLTVTWRDIGGAGHTRQYTMRYAHNGLYDYYIRTS
jgi:Tfp pilus assembly protein PilV